jgi:hypothetical protein
MYRKDYGVKRNWLGYVTADATTSTVLIKWWDNEMKYWCSVQAIPAANLDLIGRLDEEF